MSQFDISTHTLRVLTSPKTTHPQMSPNARTLPLMTLHVLGISETKTATSNEITRTRDIDNLKHPHNDDITRTRDIGNIKRLHMQRQPNQTNIAEGSDLS